jgi:hypothetical protein
MAVAYRGAKVKQRVVAHVVALLHMCGVVWSVVTIKSAFVAAASWHAAHNANAGGI